MHNEKQLLNMLGLIFSTKFIIVYLVIYCSHLRVINFSNELDAMRNDVSIYALIILY